MARSHAKILCKVWQDPEWCALKPREQWAFTLLLSQPRLNLVGVLDYMPARWVAYGDGLTVEYIELCIAALEQARYVLVDPVTQELLIRTFTRHDGIPIANERLRKGLWGAYEQVGSATLRKVAVDNMPDSFFDFDVPDEAEHFRRSEPMEWVIERPMEQAQEQGVDSPEALDLPPLTCHLSPAANAQPDTRRAVLEAAADLIGAKAAARPTTQNPGATQKAVAAAVCRDRYQDAYAYLAANPAATPAELADHLEPPAGPTSYDLMGAAQRELADRERRRRDGTACPDCGDNGVILGDNNTATRCPCRSALQIVPAS